MRDAPGDTEALSGDIDTRRDDNRCLNALGEDLRDVLKIHRDRLTGAVGDIHADLSVVDGDLHPEAGRILAGGNPLAVDLLNARADELLHEILEDSTLAAASEPLAAVGSRSVQELLLHVQEEVVEVAELTGICARLRLGVDVASLERERHLIGVAVLSLADVDAHGVDRLGDADLEALSIVLDRNRLAARLVHADVAERDLGSIESRDGDNGSGRHSGVVYLGLDSDPRIRFQRRVLNSTQGTMVTCAAVRKRGSTDQCHSRALVGHTLCGTHAKCKSVVLWVTANQEKVLAAQRIQALARGWLIRSRLALAGPGVLRRKDLANDDELVSCDSASELSPMEYVSFVENGKTWWFSFATLWTWARSSPEPCNPYTKVPLSVETRKRLHRLWSVRRRRGELVPVEATTFRERLESRWNIICQIFAEHGLGAMNPELFTTLTKNDYILVFRMLRDDLRAALPSPHALHLIHRCLITAWTLPPGQCILQGSYAVMTMLLHARDPYPLAFYILAALYRL